MRNLHRDVENRKRKPGKDGKTLTCSGHSSKNGNVAVCMYGHTCSKIMDQPGKVANPARGRLNRENGYV